jgi:hypothetical protein
MQILCLTHLARSVRYLGRAGFCFYQYEDFEWCGNYVGEAVCSSYEAKTVYSACQ